MNKDADPSTSQLDNVVNLWLCVDNDGTATEPDGICDNNGEGSLSVHELLFNAFDPDGVGAFEFVVKFDQKIFDIVIKDTRVLYKDGGLINRLDGGFGCTITIVTENDIRYGCVSEDNPSTQEIDLGLIGPGPFALAILNFTPEADITSIHLSPAPGNGVQRTIIDNNCQASDIFGDPLQTASGALLPGVLPGGLIGDCSDVNITVRILEGDVNLDCRVDAADAQEISLRLGATEGTGLYDQRFDLEPVPRDGDIDDDDLQVVLSRDGSTCKNPMPPQPPRG